MPIVVFTRVETAIALFTRVHSQFIWVLHFYARRFGIYMALHIHAREFEIHARELQIYMDFISTRNKTHI